MIPQNMIMKDLPINIVGSTVFGRYPKISVEQTLNMIISDGWLVDYAGFKNALIDPENPVVSVLNPNGNGRGLYRSTSLNIMIAVVYNQVYLVNPNITFQPLFSLESFSGDVFISEDIAGNIAICDQQHIYIYNDNSSSHYKINTDFTPGYISYQNGRFISVDLMSAQWRLSEYSGGVVTFPFDSQHVGSFQTKADIPIAAIPFPGKGNLLFVMGSNVTELWTDQGLALFPYQRATGINIQYGCLNSDTIAVDDDFICWLAGSEKSGPFIAYSTGGKPERISEDGIDFELARLSNPRDSHGFLFRQDGHLIYQISFPSDNLSYVFDFNTKKFFTVTDQNMNYHPGKRVAYFNNTYYFVSLNDGGLYEFDTSITNYNYGYNYNSQLIQYPIPRIRVTNTVRMDDQSNFITNSIAIPFEMGVQSTDTPVCDISISNDGGESFGNYVRTTFNTLGNYRNRFTYMDGLGMSNEFTLQLRLFSMDRFTMGNGIASVYQ